MPSSRSAIPSSRAAEARRRRAARVAALTLTLALAAGPAVANPAAPGGDIAIDYRFYVGGLNFMAMHVSADLEPGRYRVATRAETQGLADTLFPFEGVSDVEGAIEEGLARPRLYTNSSDSLFGTRSVRMEYGPGGPSRVTAEPVDPEHDRDAVPEKMRAGTVDPLSAGLVSALAQSAAASGSGDPAGAAERPLVCPASVAVFDGRRRYDLAFVAAGEDVLKTSHEAAYGGPAIVCRVEVKRIAGFSRRWMREEERRPSPPSRIWLARLGPERVVLPVRLESRTQWGAAIAHLERLAAGGHVILEAPGLKTPGPEAKDPTEAPPPGHPALKGVGPRRRGRAFGPRLQAAERARAARRRDVSTRSPAPAAISAAWVRLATSRLRITAET